MSITDSTFGDLDENETEDEYEPQEMKYTPGPKVSGDADNVIEEGDIDDSYIKRAIKEDDEEEETTTHRGNKNTPQRRTSGRVTRTRGAARLTVKEDESNDELEESANDEEWSPDEDDSASERQKRKHRSSPAKKGGGKGARKRQSSEERRQKAKERMSKLRGKHKGSKSEQIQKKSSVQIVVKVEVDDSDKEESKSRSRSARKGGKKKSSSDTAKLSKAARRQRMTPEEREAHRTKERERARMRREKLRNANDPEKLEEQRAKERERKRLSRALLKEAMSETFNKQPAKGGGKARPSRLKEEATFEDADSKLEEIRRKSREKMREIRELAKQGTLPEDRLRSIEIQKEKDRERKRAKRALMTPEEKKAEVQKRSFYRMSKMAMLPEDEKEAVRIRDYMRKQAKLAEETSEEREKRMEKLREKGREYYHRKKDTMDKEKMRERQRQWWHGMDPERKNQYKERYREMYRKRMEALKIMKTEDPEKWAGIKEQWTEREKLYKQQRKEMIYVRKRRKEDGETTKRKRKRYARGPQKKWADFTEEEKERNRERRRICALKKKLAIQKLLDSGMTMEQIKQQTETPEQRERRCIQLRIRKARSALRIRLRHLGATPEEIKEREEELKRTYQPTMQFRPYKPRPDNWRPLDPNEVAKLEAEGKLDDLDKIGPFALNALLPKPRPSKQIMIESTVIANVANPEGQVQKRRGRKPRNLTSEQEQIKSERESTFTQPTTIIPNHQQYHQPNISQFQYQGHSSSSFYHQYQQHHQPQQISQPCSLQNIVEGLTYHQPSSGFAQQATAHSHYDTSTTSSQHEYESSYHGTDNYDETYSPPASPAGGDEQENYNDHSRFISTTQTRNSTFTSTVINEDDEQKPKTKKKKKQRPYRYIPSKNPNAKLRGSRVLNPEKRTIFCDECPESFTLATTLNQHKKRMHNPFYDIKNRTCLICHEPFKHAQVWFSHYFNVHLNKQNVRKRAAQNKPFVCDFCGSGYLTKAALEAHQYKQHSDQLKEDQRRKCQLCLKSFKTKIRFNNHMLKFHGDKHIHECYRCDNKFPSLGQLREHVKAAHPESYFPCPDCRIVRFTELALLSHIRHGRCCLVNSEMQKKLKESFCIEQLKLACELCNNKTMTLGNLTRHYRTMHGAKEDFFRCSICKHEYKNRLFWAVHLEEKHQVRIEEIADTVRGLNMPNRDGVSIKPLSRRQPRQKRKADSKGGQRSPRKKIRSSKRANSDNDDASETEDENDWTCDEDEDKVKEKSLKKEKKRRKITVIAEEDEANI